MNIKRDDFEEEEFEEEKTEEESDFIEEFEEEEMGEDLFEEEDEKPSPKTSKKKKPKKAVVEAQNAKKPLTKYLLIGIAALCFIGGGLWVVMPVLMPGSQAQYPANQDFQTTSPGLMQPQTSSSKNQFVEPTPKPAVQKALANQSQPVAQNQNNLSDMNQTMVDPVPAPKENIDEQRFDDIHELLVQQGKKLEKLERIYSAVQEIKSRPINNKSFEKDESLKKENEKLRLMVADLEKKNKDLTGKNTHLRYLQNEQAKEIKTLNSKLPKPRYADFTSNWQLTGLSTEWAVLLNTKTKEYLRVHTGEVVDGVTILKIDSYAGVINTTAGELAYNAG